MTQQTNVNTVYLILQGIKKFQVVYFKRENSRSLSLGSASMEFGKQDAHLLKININGHQLRGIIIDNIQLKGDWNLEEVIKS